MAENKEHEFEAIFAVVNNGFADSIMVAAREAGAKGGTILRARGSSNIGVDKKYGLTVTPEKEILVILSRIEIKDAIMDAIYKHSMDDPNNKAIVFSLPAESIVGLKYDKYDE